MGTGSGSFRDVGRDTSSVFTPLFQDPGRPPGSFPSTIRDRDFLPTPKTLHVLYSPLPLKALSSWTWASVPHLDAFPGKGPPDTPLTVRARVNEGQECPRLRTSANVCFSTWVGRSH